MPFPKSVIISNYLNFGQALNKVKKVKKEHLECYIYGRLLLIILCWGVARFTGMLLKRHEGKNISYSKHSKR
jgi:hypothetical protein